MQVTTTCKPVNRAGWRAWLEQHHGTASEVWLLFDDRPDTPTVSYLDAVEEALCFGWIDSTQKRFSAFERAQRFSPRKKRSNWTELNKARAPADRAGVDGRSGPGHAARSGHFVRCAG